jgi:hypothetical protein
LEKLDLQPPPGEELIVLSEHVDYWNHIGWKDPYSARYYSDRQSGYGKRFGLDSVYTPQMVVDGMTEFVGSDAVLAERALSKALSNPKIEVRLSAIGLGPSNVLRAHVATGALPDSFRLSRAQVYIAVALNRAESQVSHGENAGRRLTHVAVVRNMVDLGAMRAGQAFQQDVQLTLAPGTDGRNLRLIAFVQEPAQGRVIGATMEYPTKAN